MKSPEMILGYAEYDDSKYPFVYEEGILNLLPSNENEWHKQKLNLLKSFKKISDFKVKHEWITNQYIRGQTNEGKNILFISKGIPGNNNGFIQLEIKIIYEYEVDDVIDDKIDCLKIASSEVDYFFNPIRYSDTEFNYDEKDITIKMNNGMNNINCGVYSSGDMSVNIGVSWNFSYSLKNQNPLTPHNYIYFKFNKSINLDDALNVVYQLKSFLMYICYRKNISLREIDVLMLDKKRTYKKKGKIYILSEDTIEKNKDKKKQILTLDLLENKISSVFQEIADGKVYLEHICNCIDDKRSYNIARIILIFTAFEREYKNFFSSNPIRSDRYFKVKNEVISLLENYKGKNLNSKGKKDVDKFINIIENSDNSLSMCIKNAINKNKEILDIFLKYHYQNCNDDIITNLAKRMNIMRNNIAHGNLDLKIEAIHVSDFIILEILTYVMRLNSLDISTTSIKKSICQLFGYNFYILDKQELSSVKN